MLRKLVLIAFVPMLISAGPALAVSAKEKLETCKIGAAAEHLTGAKRTAFIKKCMGRGDYEPAARKAAMKKERAMKKMKKKTTGKPVTSAKPPQ